MDRRDKLSMKELIRIIEEDVDEPRRNSGNMRHKLVDIMAIILIGVICGCEEWIEIEDFAHEKEWWLREFLELPNGIPSDDTYRRVMERIKPKQIEKAYRRWVLPYVGGCLGKQVSIDGKTVCGANREGSRLHVISAWVREDGISLGQISTNEKSNEITAIPELLDAFELCGATVSIDAIGCQTAIAEKIVKSNANYVLAVKQNQPGLYEAMDEYFKWACENPIEQNSLDRHIESDGEHGRITRRTVEVSHDVEWYEGLKKWKQLSTMIRVTRRVERGADVSIEYSYYISNAQYDAKYFAKLIRGHWSIENNLHWQLDVSFGEDDSQIHNRNSAENLSVVRKIAKAMLQNETTFKASILRKRHKALMNHNYLMSVLRVLDSFC